METLGLDPALVIAQIISFLLLFIVLRKFLYPQIESALQSRRQAIKDTYSGKEEIEQRLKEFETEKAGEHEKMKKEIQKLLTDAKAEAAQIKQSMREEAKNQAAIEIQAAQKQIDQQKDQAKKELEKHSLDIAKSLVSQLLEEKSQDAKWQKAQLKQSLDALK